eukprot:TRINITY_DN1952_c0_g1_i1.p1 TRINITY_DN1952_c0_g1~~TRINITY_DN1952_c0_g1_i1.p1  ORF type:complete len:100 (+),score=26.78 TRINITY_DN1952_c0_g1_i1:31-330(+)
MSSKTNSPTPKSSPSKEVKSGTNDETPINKEKAKAVMSNIKPPVKPFDPDQFPAGGATIKSSKPTGTTVTAPHPVYSLMTKTPSPVNKKKIVIPPPGAY